MRVWGGGGGVINQTSYLHTSEHNSVTQSQTSPEDIHASRVTDVNLREGVIEGEMKSVIEMLLIYTCALPASNQNFLYNSICTLFVSIYQHAYVVHMYIKSPYIVRINVMYKLYECI